MSRDRAFGVTGRTGAAAADALLRSGHPVRVVARDPAKGRPWAERGAEVAVADLTDLASIGTLPTFRAPPQRPLPMVATADVGSTATVLLQEERTGTRVVTLSGPKDYAPNHVAAIVSAALKKPVDVAVLQEAERPKALMDAHFSKAALAGFAEMTRGLNCSHIDRCASSFLGRSTTLHREGPAREHLRGRC